MIINARILQLKTRQYLCITACYEGSAPSLVLKEENPTIVAFFCNLGEGSNFLLTKIFKLGFFGRNFCLVKKEHQSIEKKTKETAKKHKLAVR